MNRLFSPSGRINRRTLAQLILIAIGIWTALVVFDALTRRFIGYGIVSSLFALPMVWPIMAAYIKRLHDIGLRGWWLSVPGVNALFLLALLLWRGEREENTFGPQPAPNFSM